MSKGSKFRVGIEVLLIAVLGVGVYKVYTVQKERKQRERNEERDLRSDRFIRQAAQNKVRTAGQRPRNAAAVSQPDAENEPEARVEEPVGDTAGDLVVLFLDHLGEPVRSGSLVVTSTDCGFEEKVVDYTFGIRAALGTCSVSAVWNLGDQQLVTGPRTVEIVAGKPNIIQLQFPAPAPSIFDVGISFRRGEEWFEITDVVAGGAAAQKGIRAGDVIIEVNGVIAAQLNNERFAEQLRGPSGTRVRLIMAVPQDDGWVEAPVEIVLNE